MVLQFANVLVVSCAIDQFVFLDGRSQWLSSGSQSHFLGFSVGGFEDDFGFENE